MGLVVIFFFHSILCVSYCLNVSGVEQGAGRTSASTQNPALNINHAKGDICP
jgi:hypothetical protein